MTVGVGTDHFGNILSNTSVYPGGHGPSLLFGHNYCDSTGNACQAAMAGLYLLYASATALRNIANAPAVSIGQWGSNSAFNQTGNVEGVLDVMNIGTDNGLLTVSNSTITTIHQETLKTPSGFSYSPQIGILSLGEEGNGTNAVGNFTGQTFPGYLRTHDLTPSNSFGLHYGSAVLGLGGSLVWGGYDQSRVIGEVGIFQLRQPDGEIAPSILDIQIGVEIGSSPFSGGDSFTNLLQHNDSLDGFQPAVINPGVPYFFFSPETCANIAQHLPVTLHSDIGLYMWNIADSQYRSIIQSPTYLAIIFQTETGNLTVKVPFQLLNLTLESPIIPLKQQYFPCQPFHALDGSGNYYLGRAFLQAAFLSVNWESSNFFLAQGPGPTTLEPNIQPIQPEDTGLTSMPVSNFVASWKDSWVPLPGLSQGNNSNSPGAPSNTTAVGSQTATAEALNRQKGGLSSKVKIGVGVGVSLGSLALAGIALVTWLCCRGRVSPTDDSNPQHPRIQVLGDSKIYEKDGRTLYNEAPGDGLDHEVPADRGIYELDSSVKTSESHVPQC